MKPSWSNFQCAFQTVVAKSTIADGTRASPTSNGRNIAVSYHQLAHPEASEQVQARTWDSMASVISVPSGTCIAQIVPQQKHSIASKSKLARFAELAKLLGFEVLQTCDFPLSATTYAHECACTLQISGRGVSIESKNTMSLSLDCTTTVNLP